MLYLKTSFDSQIFLNQSSLLGKISFCLCIATTIPSLFIRYLHCSCRYNAVIKCQI
nr:MAG TPA: hypothetical protein [Caudoviricetes sp.]